MSRSGNNTQLQMYNTGKANLLANQPAQGMDNGLSQSLNTDLAGGHNRNNTVNINMNIMTIGL